MSDNDVNMCEGEERKQMPPKESFRAKYSLGKKNLENNIFLREEKEVG